MLIFNPLRDNPNPLAHQIKVSLFFENTVPHESYNEVTLQSGSKAFHRTYQVKKWTAWSDSAIVRPKPQVHVLLLLEAEGFWTKFGLVLVTWKDFDHDFEYLGQSCGKHLKPLNCFITYRIQSKRPTFAVRLRNSQFYWLSRDPSEDNVNRCRASV